MIKVGDKVICIKNFTYKNVSSNLTQSYTIGNFYVIHTVGETDVYISADLNEKEDYFIGVWFSIRAESYFDKFSDYFITSAEWRDKQINSILDD